MGEKYLGQLTAKSAPATGDIMVLEDSEDTKKIDYDALANAILNKLTTKTYTVAGGTNTLIAAIDALNSNNVYVNSVDNVNSNLISHEDTNAIFMKVYSTEITRLLTNNNTLNNASAQIWFTKANNTTFQYVLALLNTNNVYTGIYNPNTSTVNNVNKLPTRAEMDTITNNVTIDVSNNHTLIPSGSDFNNYTTPGVYYVMSDSDGNTMVNAPRKSSGKLIVMARHTAGYLAQYFYPSSSAFIRYVRSYINGTWYVWVTEEINYYNNQTKVYDCGAISSASNKTFEELGLSKYQYGAYFVVFRGDSASDASWVGIVRHNSSGYQISEIYKGAATNTAYVDSNGIVKTDNATGLNIAAFVQPLLTWGNIL